MSGFSEIKRSIKKNKKTININNVDINKIVMSKKETLVEKVHLNRLLDMMMIMMILDHYA